MTYNVRSKVQLGFLFFIWCYGDIMITIWVFLVNYRNVDLCFVWMRRENRRKENKMKEDEEKRK